MNSMKKFMISILTLFALSTLCFAVKDTDTQRINDIKTLDNILREYYQKVKYYPLGNGNFTLPVCVYITNKKNVLPYNPYLSPVNFVPMDIFIKEIQNVLGKNIIIPVDPLDENTSGKYIYHYYCLGGSYLLSAHLSSPKQFTVSVRIPYNENFKSDEIKPELTHFEHRNFGKSVNRLFVSNYSKANEKIFTIKDIAYLNQYGKNSKKSEQKLYNAAFEGNIEKIEKLLNKGVSLNPIHRSYNRVNNPLIAAIKNKNIKLVDLLIKKGSDVNCWGTYFDSALLYVFEDKNPSFDIFKLLVLNGADLNTPNAFGFTPFIVSCLYGDEKFVKFSIENGADVNSNFLIVIHDGKENEYNNYRGQTPLTAAISGGHIEIVKLLIENGADITLKNGNDKTPLQLAKELKKEDIIKILNDINK